jgi:hypothetical protein
VSAVVLDMCSRLPRKRKRPAKRACCDCGRMRRAHARNRCNDCYERWRYEQHNLARAIGGVGAWPATIRGQR